MYRPPLHQRSAELRQQMEHVRSRLPASMDLARADVQRLKSWKFHVRRHPGLVAAAVMGLAYWVVPRGSRRIAKRGSRAVPDRNRSQPQGRWQGVLPAAKRGSKPEESRPSVPPSILAIAGSFLLRHAVSFATSYATGRARAYVASRFAGGATARPTPPPGARGPRAAIHKPSQPERTYDR